MGGRVKLKRARGIMNKHVLLSYEEFRRYYYLAKDMDRMGTALRCDRQGLDRASKGIIIEQKLKEVMTEIELLEIYRYLKCKV